MKIKKNRNRIILCLCSILVLFASVFAFIPINKESKTVYADSVSSDYSFSGSNISSKTTFTDYSYINLFDGQFRQGNNVDNSISTRICSTLPIYLQFGSTYTFHTNLDMTLFDFVIFVHPDLNSAIHKDMFGWYSSLNTVSFSPSINGYFYIVVSLKDRTALISPSDVSSYDFELIEGVFDNSTEVNYDFDFTTDISVLKTFKLSSNVYSNGDQYKLYSYSDFVNNTFTDVVSDVFSISQLTVPPSNENPGFLSWYFRPRRLTYKLYDNENLTYLDSYSFNLYACLFYVKPADTTISGGMTLNFDRVILGSYKDYNVMFSYPYNDFAEFDISTQKYNFISYVDVNNFTYNIFIPLDSPYDSDFWDLRTYYINSFGESIANENYNSGYTAGYQNGYIKGETTGLDQGYSNGYKTGKNDGYNLGYNQALENGERYTFTALISSVIDVPVKAFTSLFNFEILGVNLSGFFLGLLTCCIVIGVIRLIL